ncbi:MAG TPA: 50S ribosomal protein L28 [Candidatus Limnocylindria bacterium]|nr:50S ribosomal protein L28 [Candidatus Limnocylindria bacterium]
MGKFCEVCEKGVLTGHKVSHSNRKSNRDWAPNVQSVHALIAGVPRRINVCTRCLRSGKVVRAVPSVKEQPQA